MYVVGKIMLFRTYVEKDGVSIGISVVSVNAIKSLRELHITDLLPNLWIHQEAHGFSHSLAVVNVVITIQVEHEGRIGENTGNTNLQNTIIIKTYTIPHHKVNRISLPENSWRQLSCDAGSLASSHGRHRRGEEARDLRHQAPHSGLETLESYQDDLWCCSLARASHPA